MLQIGKTLAAMKNYDAYIHIKSLERSFNKLSNSKSGRSQNGYMHNFLVGVYYNYKMTVGRGDCTDDQWDSLWDLLSEKQEYYYIRVPYNQGSLTFKAYITSGTQRCKRLDRKKKKIIWDCIDCNFVACEPCLSSGAVDGKNYTYKKGDV